MTDERTTAYLLDELPEHEALQFEEECFSQSEWPKVELESAEDDLIQAYLKKELSPERRRRFEENYLTTAARTEKVLIARSALRAICQQKPTWTERVSDFFRPLASPQVPRFATILVAFGLASAVLWFSMRPTPPRTFAHMNLAISYDNRAGGGHVQSITLPLAEDALKISLALPQPAPQGATYRVQWENVKRPLEDLKIERQDTNSVSVIIPADKLAPGQYLLKLFRQNPNGSEEPVQGSYLFNAIRPVLEASDKDSP